MSLVPLIFRDWWDDFDRDRPSRLLDQHFGIGLNRDDLLNNWSSLSSSLIRPGKYYRPWRDVISKPQQSGSSSITSDNKQFQVILDVQQFAPNEIKVKVSGDSVIVEGKHEEKQDEHGFVSRQFVRRYVLPKEIDPDQTVSSLSSDGVLTVSVPKKVALPEGERIVPITQTGTRAAIQPSGKETEIKVEQEKPQAI